ncbi:hypothetical protein NXS19_014464 [Fusarium pseudograminearum]|nr:hypothetical protein NXS19_014464 [Fusarium pseudograminearum]
MQSPNPDFYEGNYLELDYRTPSLPVFDSPSRSLAGYSQAPGDKRKLPLLQLSGWDSDFEDDETDPTCTVPAEIRGRPGFLQKVSKHGSSVANAATSSASRLYRYSAYRCKAISIFRLIMHYMPGIKKHKLIILLNNQ